MEILTILPLANARVICAMGPLESQPDLASCFMLLFTILCITFLLVSSNKNLEYFQGNLGPNHLRLIINL